MVLDACPKMTNSMPETGPRDLREGAQGGDLFPRTLSFRPVNLRRLDVRQVRLDRRLQVIGLDRQLLDRFHDLAGRFTGLAGPLGDVCTLVAASSEAAATAAACPLVCSAKDDMLDPLASSWLAPSDDPCEDAPAQAWVANARVAAKVIKGRHMDFIVFSE